jgi:hypothetical protein
MIMRVWDCGYHDGEHRGVLGRGVLGRGVLGRGVLGRGVLGRDHRRLPRAVDVLASSSCVVFPGLLATISVV